MESEQGTHPEHRAIVWHAPEEAAPARLLAALEARGIEAIKVQSPYRALAELCRVGRGSSPAIVIVHPEALPDAVALLEAKARYAPGARCWMYGPASQPALRAIVESDIAAWGDPSEPELVVLPREERPEPRRDRPRPVRPATPRLKLTGEPAIVPPAAEEAPSTAPLLSPEEIRMLLGDDEPTGGAQR